MSEIESAITLEAIDLIVNAPDAGENYVRAEIETHGEGADFRQRCKAALVQSDEIVVTAGELPVEIINLIGIIETVPAGETRTVLTGWRVRFDYTFINGFDSDDYTANTYTMTLEERPA